MNKKFRKGSMIQAAGTLFLSVQTKRFLLLMRDDDSYNNTWATVGGRAEMGETVIESLSREIIEEIGFLPLVRKTIPIDLFASNDGKFEFHTFICLVDKEFIPNLNNEHNGYAWSSVNGFPKPLHPALHNALKNHTLKTKIENILQLLEVSETDELIEVDRFIIR
jgi:8-oxo-dGTP pyrophosphatase MutT (NUDIX family)